MFNTIYTYLYKTDESTNIPDTISPQSGSKPGVPAPRLESQYRGISQLVNGRVDVEFATVAKNPQVFLNNSSNWDLIRIENRNTLLTGKFTVVSNNNASDAIVDWLVITERNLPRTQRSPTPVDGGSVEIPNVPKMQKPIVTNTQRDLLTELLQKINTKTIENKPIEEPQEKKLKKRQKTDFEKELQKKKNVIMRKISIKEIVQEEKEPEQEISTKSKSKENAIMHKRKVDRK